MIRRSTWSSQSPSALPPRRPPAPPPQGSVWGRVGWVAVGVVVGGGVLYLTWGVIAVLVASAVLAYFLQPVLVWLERRRISREIGIVVVALSAVLALLVALLIVIPGVVAQLQELLQNLTPYIENLTSNVSPWRQELERRLGVHVPVSFKEALRDLPSYVQRLSPDARKSVQAYLQNILSQVAGGGLQFVLTLLQASLVVPFTFFLAKDWPHMLEMTEQLIPARRRALVRGVATEMDGLIMAFVKGQLTVASVLAGIYTAGLLVAGIDLAVTVGVVSGVLFLVPYLGTAVGVTLASSLALLKFGFDWHVVVCVITYVAGQLLESLLLTPWLVGDRVGLHPLVVMVAVIVWGNVLGVWGVILAVPVTAILFVLGRRLLAAYLRSHFYRASA